MFGAIAGGIASALAGGAMSKLFGGGQKAASGGIQGDVLATDNNTVGMGDAGIKSAIQGSNVPNPDEAVPSFVSGAMAKAGKGLLEGTLQAGTSAVSDKLLDLVGLGGKSAADKGKDTRDYLAAAFPELNAWERAGADASSAGMVDAGFENQKELTKMQLDNQKEIAEMQNETQKEIAGIQSATSRQNTKDQVYAQNEMLAYQQKESTARVASIMENTNLSKQQQVSEIMRQMLTQAQTAGQYFTNDQIKEMTRKVSAEVDLVHQQTQNQRYGSSHIGATAKDISNVVTRSEERRVGKECRNRWSVKQKTAYEIGLGIPAEPLFRSSEIMRQMLTQAQTAGQYFTNDQIKEMTRKVSAEVDLVHQQTQNQRYGSSHIGATAKDISNVVT